MSVEYTRSDAGTIHVILNGRQMCGARICAHRCDPDDGPLCRNCRSAAEGWVTGKRQRSEAMTWARAIMQERIDFLAEQRCAEALAARDPDDVAKLECLPLLARPLCSECGGTGKVAAPACAVCGGTGEVVDPDGYLDSCPNWPGHGHVQCPACRGTRVGAT